MSGNYRIIVTHGNGPQVGHLLLQQERCRDTARLPLEILVAQTQGQLGYMIESTLDTELMAIGVDFKPIVSLISEGHFPAGSMGPKMEAILQFVAATGKRAAITSIDRIEAAGDEGTQVMPD